MVPMCNTKEMAQAAVDVAKYAPLGKRGVCNPRTVTYGAKGLEDMLTFVKEENDNIMILAQIETAQAVDNLPEILTVKGIDCCFIGPVDLSHSLGRSLEFDNPEYKSYLEKAFELGKKANMPMGILSFDAEQSNEFFKKAHNYPSPVGT